MSSKNVCNKLQLDCEMWIKVFVLFEEIRMLTTITKLFMNKILKKNY